MIVPGVKLNGYDAVYEKAIFDVVLRGRNYEIRDHNSGITFFIDREAFSDKEGREKRTKATKGHGEGHTVL